MSTAPSRKLDPIQSHNSNISLELLFQAWLLRDAPGEVMADADLQDRGNFFLAAGRYFQASWAEMDGLQALGLPPEEVPVALLISRHAGVGSEGVCHLRLSGFRWSEVLSRHNVTADALYAPLATGVALPEVPPWSEGTGPLHEAWKSSPMSDEDIVNLANLTLLSRFYRLRPDTVIALRRAGWSFSAIHTELSAPAVVEDRSRGARRVPAHRLKTTERVGSRWAGV